MKNLGRVTLNTKIKSSSNISFDESVCGMLFDLAYETNVFDDYPILEHYFGNNQTILIHNLEEASMYGLKDDGFLHGIPYYHISMFYKYIDDDADLYITFAKCMDNNNQPTFDIVQEIQLAACGRIFQLGVWTEQYLWIYDENKEIKFSPLLSELQAQINTLMGIKGNLTNESSPFNIILSPCTASIQDGLMIDFSIDFQKIPEGINLGFNKVSVILGQEGSDEIHTIQKAITNLTPVGLLGFAMAALCLASAEMSIAYVGKFDLNKNDDIINPELGFGNNAFRTINDNNLMSSINRIRQNVLSQKGYIIPVGYKAKEAGVFFSSDQTMSDDEFGTLTNNRVINKCRRIIRSVLLPNVNNNMMIDTSTGKLSSTSAAIFQSDIIKSLDRYLVNSLNQSQISDRKVIIDTESRILNKDELLVKCTFIPVGTSDVINFIDDYELIN